MNFTCPTCDRELPRDIAVIIPHTEEHIVDEIKKKHPEWIETKGICKRCYDFYKSQLHPKE